MKSALLLGLCATLGLAQAPRSPQHPPRNAPPSRVQDPRFMARLFQWRASRIQSVLGLPEDRARMMAEKWGRWDREHMERGQQTAELRRQFHQILMGPEAEDEKNVRLKPVVDGYMTLRRAQEAGRKQFEEDIRAGLSPAQQARLILVMEEIQQKLREGLKDAR
ncbi:hypothetical protein [Mesoterricola silvestris]|nr:hypothetical protein [Mesoterricola silvestris]